MEVEQRLRLALREKCRLSELRVLLAPGEPYTTLGWIQTLIPLAHRLPWRRSSPGRSIQLCMHTATKDGLISRGACYALCTGTTTVVIITKFQG